MSAGLFQLLAVGSQDVYLTGSPQITFFKVVYRRHTNFSIESIEHQFNGQPDFGKTVQVDVKRNGDLITKMYVRVTLPSVTYDGRHPSVTKFAWARKLGNTLINTVECRIGGSQIDKHYGTWLNIWHELADDISKDKDYDRMIGDVPELTELSSPDENGLLKHSYELFIPLQFWFCRNNGLALPLIALQYHETLVYITFREFDKCCVYTGGFNPRTNKVSFDKASLMIDYIYLDKDERRRFAQTSHEYLIEQLQYAEEAVHSATGKYQLKFNHPVKMLAWTATLGKYINGKEFMGYSGSLDNWDAAANDMAKKLIMGQYAMDDDGNLYTNLFGESNVDLNKYEAIEGEALSKISGIPTEVTAIYKLKSSVPYVRITSNDNDLRDLVDGYIVIEDADVSTHTEVRIMNVNILKNELNIHHLSIPTDKYYTDERNEFIKLQDIKVYQYHNHGVFIDGTGNPVASGNIQLNGTDRFREMPGMYFNNVQPYQCAKRSPSDGINIYSFALDPISHQPSGTCNMSRIDSAFVNLKFASPVKIISAQNFLVYYLDNDTIIVFYGVNYNVYRMMSGMGGTAYSS